MSEIKISPGPWLYRGGSAVYARNGFLVATIGLSRSRGKEGREEDIFSQGNASAISAVPEMIEALENASEFINNGIENGYIAEPDPNEPEGRTLGMIDAALNKAKGKQ